MPTALGGVRQNLCDQILKNPSSGGFALNETRTPIKFVFMVLIELEVRERGIMSVIAYIKLVESSR